MSGRAVERAGREDGRDGQTSGMSGTGGRAAETVTFDQNFHGRRETGER